MGSFGKVGETLVRHREVGGGVRGDRRESAGTPQGCIGECCHWSNGFRKKRIPV